METTESLTADKEAGAREPELGRKEVYPDICVCCGRPVPEGRMICWNCEHEFDGTRDLIEEEYKDWINGRERRTGLAGKRNGRDDRNS